MTDGLYRQDPLTPEEREEFEDDLVSFCDRELDLLGDIWGMDILYAGGSSPLWIEGLSQRTGKGGTVTALDLDWERVEVARDNLEHADLPAPARLAAGGGGGGAFPPGPPAAGAAARPARPRPARRAAVLRVPPRPRLRPPRLLGGPLPRTSRVGVDRRSGAAGA